MAGSAVMEIPMNQIRSTFLTATMAMIAASTALADVSMSASRHQDPAAPTGVELLIRNDGDAVDAELTVCVLDPFGGLVRQDVVSLKLAAGADLRHFVDVLPEQRVAFVSAELRAADQRRLGRIDEYISIEPPGLAPIDGSEHFGFSMFPYYPPHLEQRMCKLLAACGAKCVRAFEMDRCYDEENRTVVPERIEGLAQRMREQAGLTTMLSILAYAPTWASTVPADRPVIEHRFAMPDLAVWKQLVEKYVAGTSFDAYEVWNEPNGGSWNSFPKNQTYAELVRATHEAVKAARPEAQVFVGSANNPDVGWPEDALRLAKGCADGVSFHCYRYWMNPPDPELDAAAPNYMAVGAAMDKMTGRYNGGKPMPLWITEFGYRSPEPDDPAATPHDQAVLLPRAFLALTASGVDRSFWFLLFDREEPGHCFGVCHKDMQIKPAFLAFRTLNEHAAGRRFGRVQKLTDNLYALTLTGDGDAVRAVWTVQHPALMEIAGKHDAIRDLYGRAVVPIALGETAAVVIPAETTIYIQSQTTEPVTVSPLADLELSGETVVAGEPPEYRLKLHSRGEELLALDAVVEVPRDIREIAGKGYAHVAVKTKHAAFDVPVIYRLSEAVRACLDYGEDGQPLLTVENAGAAARNVRITIDTVSGEQVREIPGREVLQVPIAIASPAVGCGTPVAANVAWDEGEIALCREVWVPARAVRESAGQTTTTQPALELAVWEKNAGDAPAADDLSARLAFAYDRTHLHVAVTATDDAHCQPSAGTNAWIGDSIQLAFANGTLPAGREMVFYLTDDGRKGFTAFDPELNVDGVRFDVGRESSTTTYRIALPLRLLGAAPQPGEQIRFSLILNENDTGAREGYLRWSDGIGRKKNAQDYGVIILE